MQVIGPEGFITEEELAGLREGVDPGESKEEESFLSKVPGFLKDTFLELTKDSMAGSLLRAAGVGVPSSGPTSVQDILRSGEDAAFSSMGLAPVGGILKGLKGIKGLKGAKGTGEGIAKESGVLDSIEKASNRPPVAPPIPGAFDELGRVKGPILGGSAKPPIAQSPKAPLDVGQQVAGKLAEESQGAVSGFVNKLKSAVAELAPISPEVVVKMDKTGAAKKIYDILDSNSIAQNKFLVNVTDEFLKAAGGIKKNSDAAFRVGRVLDGKLPVEALKKGSQEMKLYEYLKAKWDFLYTRYAKRLADSPESYARMAHAANQKYRPIVKVTELSPEQLVKYQAHVNAMAKIRGGSKMADLSETQKKFYDVVNNSRKKILHEEWLKRLTPGDRSAYSALERKVEKYLTHIFDRDHLRGVMADEVSRLETKLKNSTNPKEKIKLQNRINTANGTIQTIDGGGIVKYRNLPKEFNFRFFNVRKGAEGYSFDAVQAFQTYLHGFAKKFYGDSALIQASELFKQVSPEMKPYMRWFIENWAGIGASRNSWANKLAGAATSWQWMTKIGGNLRSPITNYTQKLNTIAAVGEKWSVRGYKAGFTPEGNKLFMQSGIAKEVPEVLVEGKIPAYMKTVVDAMGFLFRRVELGNRKHSFLSGYYKKLAEGGSAQEAMQAGIDLTHLTQFRYGKIGIPKPLSGPIGRVAFQFWSYPIKQMEFMIKLWKNDPMKLIKLLAYAEGGNYLLGEFAGIDLSNAFGLGLNYGELVQMGKELSEGDIRQAYRHLTLVNKGSGLVPTTFGPTIDMLQKVNEASKRGKGWETFFKEMAPVQAKRFYDGYMAFSRREGDMYPVINQNDNRVMELTGPELLMQTFGPTLKKSSREFEEVSKERAAGKEFDQISDEIVSLQVNGKSDEAVELMIKSGILPSDEALKRAFDRWYVTAKDRREMETGKRREYIRENK